MIQYQEIEFQLNNVKFKFTIDDNSAKPVHSHSHTHPNFELFFVWDGEVRIKSDAAEYILRKNQAVLISPGHYHQSLASEGTQKISFYFSFVRTGKHNENENIYKELMSVFSNILIAEIEKTTEIERYISLFKETVNSECLGKLQRLQAQLTGLIFAMYDSLNKNHSELYIDNTKISSGIDYRYEIDSLLAHNYTKDIDLSYLSEKLCLSPKRVSAIIKSLYGKSFREVKTEMRIQVAKQLLRETDLTVLEISKKVGYNSLRGFLTAFSQTTEMTPSQYRNHIV